MAKENGESTLKQKICAELRKSIIMGHRHPGEKIDVQQLSKEYGTSVTPVREAMQVLSQEGLITIKAHSGYLVTQLTLKQLHDLLELREVLELAAVERAARRARAKHIEALETVYEGYTGDDDESYARYTAENRRFHYLIAEMTGNMELASMIGQLHDRLARFMVMRRAGKGMQNSHEHIIDALRNGDASAARQAMLEELTDSHEVILERVIQEQGDTWYLGGRK